MHTGDDNIFDCKNIALHKLEGTYQKGCENMDPKNAIEIRNLTKTFKINVGDTNRKGNLFNKMPTKSIENRVIDDISLDIRKGDVLGILGRNGAGKSTFMSLIARIMVPDSGTIERSGNVASILELGMGFHPDMSGRENIYLKGELYGFSKKEIDSKIDEIIKYSGIEDYIDNPVRTYSSGMSGRLAFSIMVNVDSDILLVDEVLSVGDTTFSLKAKEHFKKMSKSGKTVIFVSHQVDFVESMCNRVIWIENGKIFKDGPSKTICAEYNNRMNESPEIIADLALAGVADSQYKLALMYRDGRIYQQDEGLYGKWIKLAADQGHTRAQVEYGDLLAKKGHSEDALNYYLGAAKKGDNEGRIRVASMNSTRDEKVLKLIKRFKQAATSDNCMNEYRYAALLLKTAFTYDERKEAFEIYLQSADHGFPQAMHQVAIMYKDATGTQKNLEKMEEYFIKASEMGFIPSMKFLYDLYISGKQLAKNDQKAFHWISKAASLGDMDAMYKLAMMYRDGIGTEMNQFESEKWLDAFSKSNIFWHKVWSYEMPSLDLNDDSEFINEILSSSVFNKNPMMIGRYIAYLKSQGKDIGFLLTFMSYLANNSNVDAIIRMANMYYDGAGVDNNYKIALEWYKKAAALGDSWAKQRLGEMYRSGRGTEVDLDQSVRYYMSAALQGNIGAIASIIALCVSGTVSDPELHGKAFSMMRSIANTGNLDAIKRMGNYCYDGVGISRDYTEALEWYKKAAALGDSWAKQRLGEMYRDGKGTPIDEAQAVRWFMS